MKKFSIWIFLEHKSCSSIQSHFKLLRENINFNNILNADYHNVNLTPLRLLYKNDLAIMVVDI